MELNSAVKTPVDEIRKIRSEISAISGHDVDKLGEELRRVEREYAQRLGVFTAATIANADRVVASWGELQGEAEDGVIESIRAVRRDLAATPPSNS